MTSSLEQIYAQHPRLINAFTYSIAAYALLSLAWPIVKRRIMNKYTAMGDVEWVGRPRKGPKIAGTAVVAGGSFAGLLCARMLSDHFEKVIIYESEDVQVGKTRKYVMQYNQLHTFLAFVSKFMYSLWPDFEDHLKAYGASSGPFTFPFWLGDHARKDPESYAQPTIFVSRAGMETIVRRLVTERCKNVEVRYKASVTGIELDDSRKQVKAVTVREGDDNSRVECTLLVDATGPALGSRKWLSKAGLPSPAKVTYDPGMTYTSTVFDLKKLPNRDYVDPQGERKVGYIYGCRPAVGESRLSGYISRIENDTILVCAATWNGSEGLPRKIEELPAYFNQLPRWPEHQLLINACCEAMPDNDIQVVRPPPCHRIGWPEISIPDNLIPIGDTVQKLNAQYGQGCSQACVCSATLNKMLYSESGNKISSGFGDRYVKTLFGRIAYLWDASRLTDYGWPGTVPAAGESLNDGKFERFVQKIVIQAMFLDPEVSRTVYNGSAQVLNHHILELFNFRLIGWILRLSIFGGPKSIPPYNRATPRQDIKLDL